MPSKRQLIQDIIAEAEQWISEQKIVDSSRIASLRTKHSITLPRVVAMIEKFAVEPYKQGQIRQYVQAEYEKGTILATKFTQMGADDPLMTDLLKQKLTHEQLDIITHFLVSIIKIILI